MTIPSGTACQVRRARLQDVAAIVSLAQEAATYRSEAGEAEVMDWLYTKGLWVALTDGALAAVAAWQAENLVSVTDVFFVSPAQPLDGAGRQLLEATEAEAAVLMCEVNVMVLPPGTPGDVRAFLLGQGYEAAPFHELHRIWRSIVQEFVCGEEELMVKRLRDRMVMVPL